MRPLAANCRVRAFSLVEVIVAVTVVAILIAIALPALGRARQASRDAASLATVRQAVAGIGLYDAAERDAFPFFATPGDPFATVMVDGAAVPGEFFMAQAKYWLFLVRPYVDGIETFRHPRDSHDDSPPLARYWLTQTAFADTEYWVGEFPPAGLSWFRGQRTASVAFPSSKSMLVDISGGVFAANHAPGFTLLHGMCDGSAISFNGDSLAPEEACTVDRPFGAIHWRGLSTLGGLGGRDIVYR